MRARALLLALVIVAGCADVEEGCPGGRVHDPGPVDHRIVAADVRIPPWAHDRDDADRRVVTTSTYRIDGGELVIEGGIAIPLADDFTIRCIRADDVDELMAARFGAAFTVDTDTLVVVSASCIGCA